MLSAKPKQYLRIGDKSILQHSVEKLLSVNAVAGLVIGIAANDQEFDRITIRTNDRITISPGGRERAETVLNAIDLLVSKHQAAAEDWVLVHDAVRPCVRVSDIHNLIETCLQRKQGGLLGCEIVDTVKQVEQKLVTATLPRTTLWRAMTPQMFPLGILQLGLGQAIAAGKIATDECAAMEEFGCRPHLLASSPCNIKITRPEDIQLAEKILA